MTKRILTDLDVSSTLNATGNISTSGWLYSNASGADEGGQIVLAKPTTNTGLSSEVVIDIYQNKLRFFEYGGSNRGYYIDITSGAGGAGTSLTGGSTGAMNYAQTEGTKQSAISAAGTTIVSTSITTNGYPVFVQVTGDVENNSAGGWTVLQLYRGTTAIGNPIHTEGSAASENTPYSLSVIDTPAAGTYTYALKLNNSAGGTFNFGESDGPVITAIELSGPKGDTGSAGATYTLPAATSTTLGGIELFSDTAQTTAANSVTTTASRTYGLQANASGQAVVNVPWTDTDTNYYPSAIVFNAGTTSGPTLDLTMSGSGAPDLTAVAIPSAGASASGVVTTGAQTFAGTKTFSSSIVSPGIVTASSSVNSDAITVTTGTTTGSTGGSNTTGSVTIATGAGASSAAHSGSITVRTGNGSGSSGNSGSVTIDSGTLAGAGTAGTISIGTTNASAITIGKTGLNISTPGGIDATQTIAGGNLTTGGTLTRTLLAGGGSSTASIDNNGRFIRTTSSARYKQDISDVTYDYQDVLSLEPKTFRLKDEVEENPESRTYAGFIAEDVHEIDSLRVFVNYLTQEDGSKIPDGIAYGEMVSALVSAIKHQDTLIKSLETRIEQLENQ